MSEVLVVDDDPVALTMAVDTLAPLGVPLHTASDWPEMNDVLFTRPVAVVVLDVKLPGLNGDVLAEFIHRNLDPAPKIVLHSSIEEWELRSLARKVGAFGMVTKAMDQDVMRRAVRAALDTYQAEHAKPASRSDPLAQPNSNGKSGS